MIEMKHLNYASDIQECAARIGLVMSYEEAQLIRFRLNSYGYFLHQEADALMVDHIYGRDTGFVPYTITKCIDLAIELTEDLLEAEEESSDEEYVESSAELEILREVRERANRMKIVNLTPHAITFLREDDSILLTVEPSGQVARADQTRTPVGTIAGIPANKCSYGAVTGLPEPVPGTIYLVSALTAQACPERQDIFIVDDTVRDENGRIIGCRAIAHI